MSADAPQASIERSGKPVQAQKRNCTFFMALPTLSLTLYVYATHVVSNCPLSREADRSNHLLRMHNEAVERRMNRCKITLYGREFRAIGSS
jgi:hypothetical protein